MLWWLGASGYYGAVGYCGVMVVGQVGYCGDGGKWCYGVVIMGYSSGSIGGYHIITTINNREPYGGGDLN